MLELLPVGVEQEDEVHTVGEVRHPGQVVGDVEEAGLGTDDHDDGGDVEEQHDDHDGEVEEAEPGGPVAPAEGQFPVELIGEHPTELAQQKERSAGEIIIIRSSLSFLTKERQQGGVAFLALSF